MKLIELTKVCSKCGERKSWNSEFCKAKFGRLGIMSICKICKKICDKNYRKVNSKTINAKNKDYREANKERIKSKDIAYYKSNQEKIRAYRKANIEKQKVYSKTYRKANLEKEKFRKRAYNAIYKIINPEKVKFKNKKSNDKRRLKPNFKLNNSMRNGMNHSLKNCGGKNGRSWESLVPYTFDELINHLKTTLPTGYKWDDYVNGKTDLSLDHIIPISAHNFSDSNHQDFQRCWALKNLQLLPAFDNMSKCTKIEKPFQPSLLL